MPTISGPKFKATLLLNPQDFSKSLNYDNPRLLKMKALQKEYAPKFAPVGNAGDTVQIERMTTLGHTLAKLNVNGRYKIMWQRFIGSYSAPLFMVEGKRAFLNRVIREVEKMANLPPEEEAGEPSVPPADPTMN